mmetsp:Transcript_19293/g.47326  ORF Transcript_19293/g.47326 Transcript_19293/m.47326 type:complete len:265 (+) Transcript_19293:392-1186(+)
MLFHLACHLLASLFIVKLLFYGWVVIHVAAPFVRDFFALVGRFIPFKEFRERGRPPLGTVHEHAPELLHHVFPHCLALVVNEPHLTVAVHRSLFPLAVVPSPISPHVDPHTVPHAVHELTRVPLHIALVEELGAAFPVEPAIQECPFVLNVLVFEDPVARDDPIHSFTLIDAAIRVLRGSRPMLLATSEPSIIHLSLGLPQPPPVHHVLPPGPPIRCIIKSDEPTDAMLLVRQECAHVLPLARHVPSGTLPHVVLVHAVVPLAV